MAFGQAPLGITTLSNLLLGLSAWGIGGGAWSGSVESGVEAIRDGLDFAEKNGVLIQITLSIGNTS